MSKNRHTIFFKFIKAHFIIGFLIICNQSKSQDTLSLNLSQSITIARQNSINAQLNKNDLEIARQNYRLQHVLLFPNINLTANLPGYTNSISSVTQPDGTIRFTTIEQAYSNIGINLSQKVVATGGTFTATSSINRFDRLRGNRITNFSTQPFILGFNQPLFMFNEMAWDLRVARINQLISSKVFYKQQEQLALEVSNQFHALLQIQQQLNLLQATKINTDRLFQTARDKLQLGKIGEEEYLQIQLEQLNNTTQLQQVNGNVELLCVKFCNLLALPTDTKILLEETQPQQAVSIDNSIINTLFNQYRNNSPEYEQHRLQKLQNTVDLKRAKLNRLPKLNLIVGYGSNQSSPYLYDAYQNLLTQQNATVGIAMPLYTSGTNKTNLKIVGYQEKNIQLQTQLLEQQIMNDLLKQVQNFNMSFLQINTAQLADSIAQRRYQISLNKYNAGKITYTDLFFAQNQQLQAKQIYLTAIAAYWQAYYQLRIMTLYDFEKQKSLYIKN